MRFYKFKICADSGRTVYICASCRKEAIEIYQQQTGVNMDYIKQHCLIKNLGLMGGYIL